MSIIKQYFDYQTKYEKIYGEDKTLVLMQVGSFYEAYATEDFGYNLHEISNLLNIMCTRRDKSVAEISMKNPELVGIPTISLAKYLKILVDNDYCIVIINQVTPPPNPKRKVVGIYSRGTYIEETNSPDTNNIISIYIEEEKQMDGSCLMAIGISCIDLTTGQNHIYETYSIKEDDKLALDDASRFIKMHDPKEILISTHKSLDKDKLLMYLEIDNYKYIYNDNIDKLFKKITYQNEFLSKIFANSGMLSVLEYLDLENKQYATISYMILLDFAYNHDNNIVNHISKPIYFEDNKHLTLGNDAIMQLNILKTDALATKNKKFQCLFDVVNQTTTAIGRRFLKMSLLNPIVNYKKIQKRYKLISKMIKQKLHEEIDSSLKNIMDIERFHRKLSLGMLHPTEFYSMHNSYQHIKQLMDLLNDKLKLSDFGITDDNITKFNNFIEEYTMIFNMDEINKYSINDISGSFFNTGYCKNIDAIQNEIDENMSYIENFRTKLEGYISDKHIKSKLAKPDASKIHLQSNERDGYYLNLTKLRAKELERELNKMEYLLFNGSQINTKDIKFKELNKGNTKITTDELINKSSRIIELKDKIKILVKEEYVKILQKFYTDYKDLYKILCSFIGYIDFIKSGAKVALLYNYCKPTIKYNEERGFVECTNLRHPIIERIQEDKEYVPNDITIGQSSHDGILLYGLNSSGKTILMKAVGLSIILAQIGYYVPAKEYVYSPYKSIFTRITGNDNLFKGMSSFVLEMTELSAILKRADPHTLIIGDEICRGTEQTSGNSIVAATIINLANKKASFIFASHLHDIPKMDRIKALENVKCYHLQVDYDAKTNNLIFNRKLQEGSGPSVYGLTVAKYLIHDLEFIQLAENIKKELTNEPEKIIANKISPYNKNIYVHECKICLKTQKHEGSLDTHHINFQKNCIEGFVKNKEHIGKNFECNLVVLCKECHRKVHAGSVIINGYDDTSNGKKLNYELVATAFK